MASWAKIKFYFESLINQAGAVLSATSEATDYEAANLKSTLETTAWQAVDTTDPCYITVDTNGAARNKSDYLAIYGHNLGTVNASVTLQHSDDAVTWTDAFTPEMLRSDLVFLKEFATIGPKRYWRLKITGHEAAPWIRILLFGMKAELDYASSSFDPNAEEDKQNENLSYGGYVAGVHIQYTERSMDLKFEDTSLDEGAKYLADGTYDADGSISGNGADYVTLWAKIKRWRQESGNCNFLVGWETANAPCDVFLMRPDGKFKNPLKNGGLYRDLAVSLTGRKE